MANLDVSASLAWGRLCEWMISGCGNILVPRGSVWSNVVENGSPRVFPNRLWQQCRKEAVTRTGYSPFFTFPGQLPLVTVPSECLSGTSGDRSQSASMGGQHAPATVRGFALVSSHWKIAHPGRSVRWRRPGLVTAAAMTGAGALPLR